MSLDSKSGMFFDWRSLGRRFYGYNFYLKRRFGHRVQKVSIDAGFTCPNVDGTVALGGCNFCDNRSFSPSRRVPRVDVIEQIDHGIRKMRNRYEDCSHFLAYFQPATNTYAPVSKLRPLFERALSHPQVVGLAIGTRSDCVPNDVLDLLSDLAAKTYVSVEYGLQSIHDRSLSWMNRGHDYASFVDAVERSRGRGFEICAHIILGIPGETHAEMMETADEMSRLRIDALKIHNLYAVKRTALGEQVERGEVKLMERDEYVSVLVDFLERIPPSTIVERTIGDAPPDYFIGPAWCLDKQSARAAIEAEFVRRDTWQGKALGHSL